MELKFIDDRTSIMGTNIILLRRKIARKNDKYGTKITKKIARKLRCLLDIFRIYSLKIFEGGRLG